MQAPIDFLDRHSRRQRCGYLIVGRFKIEIVTALSVRHEQCSVAGVGGRVINNLGNYQIRFRDRPDRQSSGRDVGNAVSVQVSQPIIRRSFERGRSAGRARVHQFRRHKIKVAGAQTVTRIITRISDQQQIRRRSRPGVPGQRHKIANCLRSVFAKTEFVVNVIDVGELYDIPLGLTLRD